MALRSEFQLCFCSCSSGKTQADTFRTMISTSFVSKLVSRCPRLLLSKTFASGKTTHFGFETVTEEEKAERVQGVFSNVSKNYDLMNDVMSFGIHRLWKERLIQKLDPYPGAQLLDVAGGTGDISFKFLHHIKRSHGSLNGARATVCDINEKMLEEGKRRSLKSGISDPVAIDWIVGDAMKLPFEENSFDCLTTAFGIRNVVDIEKALQEAHRVLKPGGVFTCLEFSQVRNPVLERLYNWYSFNVIPVYGEVLAGDWKSYQYLVESIRKFPDQEDFKSMIDEAGFILVDYENLTSGIACIHTGFKNQ